MEQEFGKQIFWNIDAHKVAESSDSLRLQSEESALKMQYRKWMAKNSHDDEGLYQVFRKLMELRCELADSLGYKSYIELGYHIQGRKELYDLETRTSKCSNLFTCCMLPYERLPFIIGNYTGYGMEAGYAVHEFGHGFAFYTAARKQPLYELHRSSPAVNEIHSKTHFMFPYLKMFVGEHKKEYIRNHLMQQLENMAYRCAIDEFEHLMYDRNMSRVQLCELWADISNRYIPWNKIPLEDIHQGKCWPRQTHIVESPFYYIQYDIAQIST